MLFNTAGYLVYDFLLFYFVVQARGTLATQTFIHHTMGATGFYLVAYCQDVTVIFGVMTLAVEISTIFLNLRWFTFEFNIKNPIIPAVNSGMLFITYFFGRILF